MLFGQLGSVGRKLSKLSQRQASDLIKRLNKAVWGGPEWVRSSMEGIKSVFVIESNLRYYLAQHGLYDHQTGGLARSVTRQELTYNYTERFARPELLPFHQKTDDLFRLGGASGDERYAVFQGWKYEDQLAALLVPNLFEELAGMYNQGLLHKRITKEFFGLTALDVWNRGSWFIERSRNSNLGYYEQWSRCSRTWAIRRRYRPRNRKSLERHSDVSRPTVF